jgi:hypothetical protein
MPPLASVPEIDGISPSQSEELAQEKIATDTNIKELQKFELSHQWDPNLPQEKLDAIKEAVDNGDHEKAVELDKSLAQDSQYDSVRAAVRNVDNGEVANTVRAWILGLLFTTVGSGLNMFLSMRSVINVYWLLSFFFF